jgi:hypothetical protein
MNRAATLIVENVPLAEAERYAELAIQLAQANIDDAEWIIIEAIASRIEKEAVSTN